MPLNRLILDPKMSVLVSLSEGWVTIFVQLEHEGYLAMGLARGMETGVVFLIEFQNSSPVISDCQMIGNSRPLCSRPLDPIYNLDDFEEMPTGGWRAIIRADFNAEFEAPIYEEMNEFSAAYGFSPLLSYHAPGQGKAFSFKTAFVDPVFVQPETATDNSTSTDPVEGSASNPYPFDQPDGNDANSTHPPNTSGNPPENATESSSNPNSSQPIVKVINPSRYVTRSYSRSALRIGVWMLGYLVLGLEL